MISKIIDVDAFSDIWVTIYFRNSVRDSPYLEQQGQPNFCQIDRNPNLNNGPPAVISKKIIEFPKKRTPDGSLKLFIDDVNDVFLY